LLKKLGPICAPKGRSPKLKERKFFFKAQGRKKFKIMFKSLSKGPLTKGLEKGP